MKEIYINLSICFTKNLYFELRMFYAIHIVCYWLYPVTVKRYKNLKFARLISEWSVEFPIK